MRIVSLLPSATEILFAVGAGDDVAGVTFECDFPDEARSRTIVSTSALRPGLTPAEIDAEVRQRIAAGEDLYHLDEGALEELAPDLVVTQDLCAVCAVDVSSVDAAMAHLGCDGRVLTVDPQTLDEVIASIITIGTATGREPRARDLAAEATERLAAVRRAVDGLPRPGVAVVEWTDPPFCAGHWVPDMVTAAGGTALLGRPGENSLRISWEDVAAATPDVVVIAPCGYRLPGAIALAQQAIEEGLTPAGVPVWAVDADAAYVRPGPRLVEGVEALAAVLHPGAVPARDDLAQRVG
ncbi:MAG TPA: ABC transporter substrate-binding protein [Mycobacteriales bacterium]|nr:ABC transporter substrate-binding protein [Mycobacteriales bacterium]